MLAHAIQLVLDNPNPAGFVGVMHIGPFMFFKQTFLKNIAVPAHVLSNISLFY